MWFVLDRGSRDNSFKSNGSELGGSGAIGVGSTTL